MAYRLCTVRLADVWDPAADPISSTTQLLLTGLGLKSGLNTSWIYKETVGEYDPLYADHTGCIRSLYHNESDSMVYLLPLGYYGPQLVMENVVNSENTMISSMYQKDDGGDPTHVLDFLDGYSTLQWFVTSCFATVLCLLLALGMTFRRMNSNRTKPTLHRVKRTIGVLLSCSLNQHSNCGSLKLTLSISCAYTVLTLLAYYSHFYLTSMIKTEMVVPKRPPTYDSYKDILDRNAKPLWISKMGDELMFRDAVKGSRAAKIWDRAVKRGINQSIIDSSPEDGSGGEPDLMGTIGPILKSMTNGSAVGLLSRLVTTLAVSNMCAYLRAADKYPDFNAWVRVDEEAVEYLRVLPVSKSLPPEVRRRMRRGPQAALEADLLYGFVTKTFKFKAESPAGHLREVEECMSNVMVLAEHEVDAVPVAHFIDLFTVCLIGLLVTSVIWLAEKVSHLLSPPSS